MWDDSSRLRAAVVGCGAIAHEHLAWMSRSPSVRLVAVCDRSRALAEAASELHVPAPVYTDAAAMMTAEKPDIVHVLTPPSSHGALVQMALAHGAHVVCEKPMAGTAVETAALLEAATSAGRVLVESRNLLFNDAVLEITAAIAAGHIGTVRECDVLLQLDFLAGPFGDANLSGPATDLPAGAVHDFLPHLVYLFQTLTGTSDAAGVHGRLENRSGNSRALYDFLDVLVDAGRARGRLRIATDVEPPAFRIVVRGSNGSIETDLYNPYIRYEGPPNTGKRAPLGQMRAGAAMIRAGANNLRHKIGQHGTTHGMGRMLEAVYRSILNGTPPPILPEQMLATARLSDAIVALALRT